MKTMIIDTDRYAAVIRPDGSFEEAGSMAELLLKTACAGQLLDDADRLRWRPGGLDSLREAVVATVSSPEPGAAYYAFARAYRAAGLDAEAYAYLQEVAHMGGLVIRADGGWAGENWSPPAAERAGTRRAALVKLLMRHPNYRGVRALVASMLAGKGDGEPARLMAESAKTVGGWGEADADAVAEAALANPALN